MHDHADRLPRDLVRYVAQEAPLFADQELSRTAPPPAHTAVHDGPGIVPAGWYELSVYGLTDEEASELKLHAACPDGRCDAIEYALPASRKGRIRVCIFLEQSVARARLVRSDGQSMISVGSVRLARVGHIRLMWRAFRQAPGITLAAAYWFALGKRRRATNRLRRILGTPVGVDYQAWLAMQEPRWRSEVAFLTAHREAAGTHPRIGVLIDVAPGAGLSADTARSVHEQTYPHRNVVILHADASLEVPSGDCRIVTVADGLALGERLEAGFEETDADWVFILKNGDRLACNALNRLANAATLRPKAHAIYGDHDFIGNERRHSPQFKPAWNLPLFLAHDYIGASVAFHRERSIRLGGIRALYPGLEIDDLLLRASRGGEGTIVHIPRILVHKWESRDDGSRVRKAAEVRRGLAEAHVTAVGEQAVIEIDRFGHVRVARRLPEPAPLVSLIVPTRDRVDLLRPCIEGLQRTDYPNLEILIVDNGSREDASRQYLAALASDRRIRVIPAPGPFNFSAINNMAVDLARGCVLGFVNNDIEILDPAWLTEMVSHALRPEIGAVGALLLYPEGGVQHAGVIGINGDAGHAHRFCMSTQLGYMRRLQSLQHVVAVTGACLVVEKAKFSSVGGFDAEGLPVVYNDIDLCLKLRTAGFSNLYTPYARLLHKESASRMRERKPDTAMPTNLQVALFRERWRRVLATDPHYSPNLTQSKENFALL